MVLMPSRLAGMNAPSWETTLDAFALWLVTGLLDQSRLIAEWRPVAASLRAAEAVEDADRAVLLRLALEEARPERAAEFHLAVLRRAGRPAGRIGDRADDDDDAAVGAIDDHGINDALSQKVSTNGVRDHLCAAGTLVLLSTVAAEQVRWVWPGRIPLGKLTVLDGDPGRGKSTLLLDVAARVTRGWSMPDGGAGDLDGPAGVVLLSAEDGLGDTIRPRLDAAGADCDRVVALTGASGQPAGALPEIPRDLSDLEAAIKKVSATLVVIDPLVAYLGAETNSWRDQDVRRALAPLAALAERLGVAIVVIRHLTKSGGGNPLYRGGGSIGITGAARAALLVAADPDDASGERRVLAVAKVNLAAPAPALAYRLAPQPNGVTRVEWLGPTSHSARELLGESSDAGERDAGDEARAFLEAALAEGERRAKEVQREARDLGIADITLRRARVRLKIKLRREGYGANGRWLWSLPSPPPWDDAEGDRLLDAVLDRWTGAGRPSRDSTPLGALSRDAERAFEREDLAALRVAAAAVRALPTDEGGP